MKTLKNTIATDRSVVRHTVAIRAAARASLGLGEAVTCPTCARKLDAPYRHTIGAPEHGGGYAVVEGCVDAAHSGRLIPGGYDAQWHDRDAARSVRRMVLDGLR
jgi:hypothetical protein